MFRSRKSRRYVSRPKRNAERVVRAGQSTITAGTQQTAYTYTADQACTVKSIKLDIGMDNGGAPEAPVVPYALVVVREGYNANTLNYPAITDDLYNPTMDVLISGILTDGAVEDHKSNAIGRKLKKGDRICLIVTVPAGYVIYPTCFFEMNFTVLT